MTSLKAWLATSRFANLPTIWSHCFVVVVFYALYRTGHYSQISRSLHSEEWIISFNKGAKDSIVHVLYTTFLAGSFLYLGGCILGDYFDRYYDGKNRPDRPIPQGIIRAQDAFYIALILLCLGFLIFLFGTQWNQHFQTFLHEHTKRNPHSFGISLIDKITYSLKSTTALATIALLACITCYAKFHKQIPQLGLTLMASCRFFLIICAWKYVDPIFWKDSPKHIFILPKEIFGYAIASAVYTMGIVFVARTESTPARFDRQKALMLFMFIVPLFSIGLSSEFSARFALASLIFILWAGIAYHSLRKNDKSAFVSRALAGFCLLDCIAIAAFSSQFSNVPDVIPVLNFFTSFFPLLICFCFFCLALILQKLTPAT